MRRRSRVFHSAVLSLVIAVAGVCPAWADTLYVADQLTGAIQTFDAATGASLDPSFVTGLDNPWGLTIAGSVLYVSDSTDGGSVRAFNVTTGAEISGFSLQLTTRPYTFVSGTTLYTSSFSDGVGIYHGETGAAINGDFIGGVTSTGIVVSEGILLLCRFPDNAVATYDAATGALINASFITGLADPTFLAVKGNTLYVSQTGGRVGTYDVTTGEELYPNLVTLQNPTGLAVGGNTLYVGSTVNDDGKVRAYDATTGEELPVSEFRPIIEVSSVGGLAVLSSVPEPGTIGLLGLAVVVGYGVFWRGRNFRIF